MNNFKTIEFNTQYMISNDGKVYSLISKKILKPYVNHKGYYCVDLKSQSSNKLKDKCFIHRLVAQHFCQGYSKNLTVDHIDNVKTNNHYTNLQWVTKYENWKKALDQNLIYKINKNTGKGEKHPYHKVSELDVINLRIRILSGEKVHVASEAKKRKVSLGCIYRIIRFKNWHHLPRTLEELNEYKCKKEAQNEI